MADQAQPLTIETLRRAMDEMRRQDDERLVAMGERARSVGSWLDGLPGHARKHVFVQQLAQTVINGGIFHPRMAEQCRAEVERISALTPDEAAADSDRAAAQMLRELGSELG